jgi:hypothetical protein
MPSEYPLDIYRGDTARWQFRLWQDAAKTSPVDLSTAVVQSEIRSSGGVLLATLDCTITVPNVVDVVLPAAAASRLTMTPARWDLQVTWDTGDVQTPIGGVVTVQLDATA